MLEAISKVQTGQITYAVRDTRIDDKEIHEGDIMGIGDRGILAVGSGREEVAVSTVGRHDDRRSGSDQYPITALIPRKRTQRLSQPPSRRNIPTAKWNSAEADSRSIITLFL